MHWQPCYIGTCTKRVTYLFISIGQFLDQRGLSQGMQPSIRHARCLLRVMRLETELQRVPKRQMFALVFPSKPGP